MPIKPRSPKVVDDRPDTPDLPTVDEKKLTPESEDTHAPVIDLHDLLSGMQNSRRNAIDNEIAKHIEQIGERRDDNPANSTRHPRHTRGEIDASGGGIARIKRPRPKEQEGGGGKRVTQKRRIPDKSQATNDDKPVTFVKPSIQKTNPIKRPTSNSSASRVSVPKPSNEPNTDSHQLPEEEQVIADIANDLIMESYEKTNPTAQPFENTLETNIQMENAEKAKELHEFLVYIDSHRDSLIEKIKAEETKKPKNEREISRLGTLIEDADYRIEVLNKIRKALARSELSKLSDEEMMEGKRIRAEVIEHKISKVNYFNQFTTVLDEIRGVYGTDGRWITNDELLGRAYLIWADKLTIDYLTEAVGIRKAMERCLEYKNAGIGKGQTNTPTETAAPAKERLAKIKVEEVKDVTTESAPEETPIETERNIASDADNSSTKETVLNSQAEEALRAEISNLIEQRVSEIAAKMIHSLSALGKEIKINVQHDYSQARLSKLMKLLKTSFTRKPNANADELEKAEQAHEVNMAELRDVINDAKLSDEINKKIGELGVDGGEIVNDAKRELFVRVARALIDQRRKVIETFGAGLPANDRKLADDLSMLAKKSGTSFLGSGTINSDKVQGHD